MKTAVHLLKRSYKRLKNYICYSDPHAHEQTIDTAV